jgi:hypothetical protein
MKRCFAFLTVIFSFATIAILEIGFAGLSLAKPPSFDREQIRQDRAAIATAIARADGIGLRRLLQEASFYAKPEAAMGLAHLGVVEALPELRELDKQFAQFVCCPQGEYGVAVIMLESHGRAAQKARLLEAACAPPDGKQWSRSVSSCAGRELAAYVDDEVVESLRDINTYGAQYSVLYSTIRHLPLDEQLEHCIQQLAAHKTPQTTEAAQEILISLGLPAWPKVSQLRYVLQEKVQKAGPTDIDSSIASRCTNILDAIAELSVHYANGKPGAIAKFGLLSDGNWYWESWDSQNNRVIYQTGHIDQGDVGAFEEVWIDRGFLDKAPFSSLPNTASVYLRMKSTNQDHAVTVSADDDLAALILKQIEDWRPADH